MSELIEVNSSMIRAVKYDAETEELEVWFHTGGVYVYEEVPAEVYEGLLAAESKGRFMRAAVLNAYPYRRVSRGLT